MPVAVEATQLCNLALIQIGADRITSFEADQSKEGRIARVIFHPTRRSVLSLCGWNGAKKAAQLTQMEDTTPTLWAFAFEVPTDLIRLLSVHPSNDPNSTCEYELMYQAGSGDDEAKCYSVASSSNQLYARYIFDQMDFGALSPGFHDAFVWELARAFAVSLPKSEALTEFTEKKRRGVITRAKAIDGQEDDQQRMAEGSWSTSRFGRYGSRQLFSN